MREILTGIFSWPWFSQPHGYNFNGHFIRHADGNLCIDPVEPTDEVLKEMVSHGVARILLTNRNHSRAANKVRARTGGRTAIHAADAPHARDEGAELDDALKPGDKVGPFVVVGVPGKSPGEIALHWPERKILLVGDAVVSDPPGAASSYRKKWWMIQRACARACADFSLSTSTPYWLAMASPLRSLPRSGFGNWWILFPSESLSLFKRFELLERFERLEHDSRLSQG